MSTTILSVPAYKILRVEETEQEYHIRTELAQSPTTCPTCAHARLLRYGRNEQLIRDLPIHGRRVGLYVDTQRWRCQACGKTFMEPLPAVDAKREMTGRLVAWIGQQSLRRTFTSIAEDIGLDEKTVRNIFRDHMNELEKTVRFETPTWVGIARPS